MNLEHKQWTLITIGLISLGTMAYYYNKNHKKKLYYQQKKQQFHRAKDLCKNKQFDNVFQLHSYINSLNKENATKSNTQSISDKKSQKKNQKYVCFFNVKPKYNDSTFKLYQRQRSLHYDYDIKNRIYQHQMGGDFTFLYGKDKIRCKLNDFHISSTLFKEDKEDVHLFKGLNGVQPLVCQVITTLKPLLTLSIYGKLYYDQGKLEWALQPLFLTQNSQLEKIIDSFYGQKKIIKQTYKFALIIAGLVLSYFTLYKPIISLINKYKTKKQNKQYRDSIQYFKNKQYLMVKGSSLLNCQRCKTKNVQMVYECGHLSLCLSCHEQNQSQQCPICLKKSNKSMKIFMA